MRITALASILLVGCTGSVMAQTAPNAPQYQTGTTNDLSRYLPSGSTSGTALNGSTQLSVPVGSGGAYVYGQNNSTSPTPTNPGGSYGGSVGVGTTFGGSRR